MKKSTAGNMSQIGRVRGVLRAGSIVFGVSSIALIGFPDVFNALLGLTTTADLEWAMRMMGVTLVALAGNMFSVSIRGSDDSVILSGWVMLVCAFTLGVLTLLLPAELNWFTIVYAAIGFGFSAAYAVVFVGKTKQ